MGLLSPYFVLWRDPDSRRGLLNFMDNTFGFIFLLRSLLGNNDPSMSVMTPLASKISCELMGLCSSYVVLWRDPDPRRLLLQLYR